MAKGFLPLKAFVWLKAFYRERLFTAKGFQQTAHKRYTLGSDLNINDAIEDIIEPYLMQMGLVQRTSRGRMLSPQAFEHIGLKKPKTFDITQPDMLENEIKSIND